MTSLLSIKHLLLLFIIFMVQAQMEVEADTGFPKT